MSSLEQRANAGVHDHVVSKLLALRPAKCARILDVGCGSGAMLDRLARLGFTSLWGVDIAPPDRPVPGVTFIEYDLDASGIPLSEQSVDLALSIEVFEHVENLGSLLGELSRVLTPDGIMLATTPNLQSLEARLRFLMLGKLKQFDDIGDPTHVLPIFVVPFERILRRHGLEIAETWGFPVDGSSPTSRGALRLAAAALRALGLAGAPAGDQLCMLIRKQQAAGAHDALAKRAELTSHYAHVGG